VKEFFNSHACLRQPGIVTSVRPTFDYPQRSGLSVLGRTVTQRRESKRLFAPIARDTKRPYNRNVKFALLTIALATAQLLAAQRVVIRLPLDETEQYYLVSFDQSRASAKDVERWMKFAEYGYYSAGVSLSGCDKSAATRMRKDLESTRRMSDQLDSETYPPQLSPVVAYLRGQLRLQLWLGAQEIRFAETGALPKSNAYGMPACRATAERASHERANGGCSVIGSWTDCILRSSASRLGRYPNPQFKAFLNEKGIRILKWEGIGD